MAPRAPADRFLFHAFLALLLWMPLPFGSNVTWASSFMEAWVFLIAGLWLVQYYRGKVSLNRSFVRAWPVTACLLATLVWLVVQELPLPAGALGLLSPRSLAIHSATHSYPSLSLDVYATRQAALQTLAYLLFFCLTLLLVHDKPRIRLLAQTIIVGGVFQAAYGSFMTLSGRTSTFFPMLRVIDLLVVGHFFGLEKVAERFQQASVDSKERVNTDRDALVMLRDFPLTGIGAGAFYAVYPMYTSAVVVTGFTLHAEDDYLQFACEFGLVFAALLGAVALASLWTAIRAQLKRRDQQLQGMGFAATMAIVAVLIHSAVDFNLQIPANVELFVVMLALGWVSRYWDPLIDLPAHH